MSTRDYGTPTQAAEAQTAAEARRAEEAVAEFAGREAAEDAELAAGPSKPKTRKQRRMGAPRDGVASITAQRGVAQHGRIRGPQPMRPKHNS